MSMVGYIWMSAESLTVHPLQCVKELARRCGISEFMLRRLALIEEEIAEIEQIDDGTLAHVGVYTGGANDILYRKATWEEIEAAWLEPLALMVTFQGEYWKATDRCVREGIPENIRGPFVPAGITCVAGWHDVNDALDEVDGPLGRYRFSVQMMGHGWPNQTEPCRQALLNLECIKDIRRTVEQVVGPVTARVCFN
jgi:hypothetical protein